MFFDLNWDSPKLPWGMQRIWNLLFWRLLLSLSRESLTCDARSLDLCILFTNKIQRSNKLKSLYFYTSDTFRPILALFTYFILHQLFLMYITTRNIFLIPDDAVVRNLIIIPNFSSQRPHLNHSFLSNVYSFDTMKFSMKHKC